MKNIAIVSNNLQIGGVQKSLINLLREIHGKYSIDLYLADDENAYRDLVPNDVNVYRLGYPFRLFGISHAKARKEGGRVWIQSLLFRGITKVFGKKYVVPFIVKKTKWEQDSNNRSDTLSGPFPQNSNSNDLRNNNNLENVNLSKNARVSAPVGKSSATITSLPMFRYLLCYSYYIRKFFYSQPVHESREFFYYLFAGVRVDQIGCPHLNG